MSNFEFLPPLPVEENAVTRLAMELFGVIRTHHFRRPRNSGTNYEILNALAHVTATVTLAAGPGRDAALDWFKQALVMNFEGNIEDAEEALRLIGQHIEPTGIDS